MVDPASVAYLSDLRCHTCHGSGLRWWFSIREIPCYCVYRAMFRKAMWDYEVCQIREGSKKPFQFKAAEYIADFELVCLKALRGRRVEQAVFRAHFLGHLRLSKAKLMVNQQTGAGLSRGAYLHAVYRLQYLCGRALTETKPYAVFPKDEYFFGKSTYTPPSEPRQTIYAIASRLSRVIPLSKPDRTGLPWSAGRPPAPDGPVPEVLQAMACAG